MKKIITITLTIGLILVSLTACALPFSKPDANDPIEPVPMTNTDIPATNTDVTATNI